MPSPHDEMRIKQLEILAHASVTYHWQPGDGFHTLAVGEQTFKGRDLTETLNHAAEWVRAAQRMTEDVP